MLKNIPSKTIHTNIFLVKQKINNEHNNQRQTISWQQVIVSQKSQVQYKHKEKN